MGRFKSLWIFVFLFVILSALAEVAGAYLLKPAINDYILPLIGKENPDLEGLIRLVLTMIAVYVIGAFSSYGSERILIFISTNTLCNIRKDLYFLGHAHFLRNHIHCQLLLIFEQ